MKRTSSMLMKCSGSLPNIAWHTLAVAVFAVLICGTVRAADYSHGSIALSINGPVAAEDQYFDQAAAVVVPASIKRGFYLTNTNYQITEVLTACAKGYHMASMWELLELSTLIYHDKHPYANKRADSGYGPPSSWNGWVRTGYSSSASSTAGTGNCLNWTSSSNTDYGVAVRLTNDWKSAPERLGPWEATSFTCDYTGPVWCVSDKKW